MRTSFAASVLAIVPLLASQAMAAPAPAPAPAPAAEPGFLSPLFSGSGFSGGEKKVAQIDEPWQLLNLYIFPNTPGDKKFQFRFGFSDNNPSNEMYITCIKLASSEEELIMDKYESCGDTDVQFRYLGDRVQLWRTFDKNTYVFFLILFFSFKKIKLSLNTLRISSS